MLCPKHSRYFIAVLDVEVAIPMRLIADVPRDRRALALELRDQRIRVVHHTYASQAERSGSALLLGCISRSPRAGSDDDDPLR
jgi:hypothetical protein